MGAQVYVSWKAGLTQVRKQCAGIHKQYFIPPLCIRKSPGLTTADGGALEPSERACKAEIRR